MKKYSIINSQLHRINNWLEWDSFLLPSMQDDKISISLVTNEYNKHFLSHCFFTKGNDKKLTEERETLTRGHTSAMWCLFNYSNIASSICRTKSSVMIRCSCAKMKPRMRVFLHSRYCLWQRNRSLCTLHWSIGSFETG